MSSREELDVEYPTLESRLTAEQKVDLAESNHIWVDAFACMRPTDELYRQIGYQIIHLLNNSPVVGDKFGIEIGRVAFIRLNKS